MEEVEEERQKWGKKEEGRGTEITELRRGGG